MMKRFLYSLLLVICFAVISCTEEVSVPDYSKDHIVLNVYNSKMTKADGNYNTNYERQLNRLDCFFYVKDKTDQPCVYYHKAEVNELGGATVPFYVNDLVLKEIFPKGALCDIFVIANLPGDHTFEAKSPETTLEKLGQFVLDMNEGEYDVFGKPFVMTGSGVVQKGKNSNATADIALKRVASKVTMTVKIPKEIQVQKGDSKVTMVPVLVDNEGNEPLMTSFRYGTKKSYLSSAYPEESDNYIWTDKIPYTQQTSSLGSYYVYTCDVPFYTYARAWEKGANNAAYVTFQMPWGEDTTGDGVADDDYKTYYYQLLVNGGGRKFEPNAWYDMEVTVGVLGSTVEALPKELEELSYFVINWTTETSNGEQGSGDRQEYVEIEKFNYLEVPQTYIEMDNVSEIAIRYNASHKIGVMWDTKKHENVEGLSEPTDKQAFYIENGSGKPAATDLPNIALSNFTDNNKGLLTFKYTLDSKIYSPAYVFITIWLDVNGDGELDDDEVLKQDITIVIYPALYIIGEHSTQFSVFVNGNYNSSRTTNVSSNTSIPYLKINNQQVGKATGWDVDGSEYMHVITVSAFNKNNCKFEIDADSFDYIIGDPRERSPYKFNVPDDDATVNQNATGWIKAKDVNGKERNLEYYYPTSTESFQVIAPKFRISSKLAGYSHSSTTGAAYRCAAYQEAGYPAGRWRLPTLAEVLFVINLQGQGKIEKLFVGSSNYASATHTINNNSSIKVEEGLHTDSKGTISVRCVYDEWYWGSEKEANENTAFNNYGGYEFTWGDRKVY